MDGRKRIWNALFKIPDQNEKIMMSFQNHNPKIEIGHIQNKLNNHTWNFRRNKSYSSGALKVHEPILRYTGNIFDLSKIVFQWQFNKLKYCRSKKSCPSCLYKYLNGFQLLYPFSFNKELYSLTHFYCTFKGNFWISILSLLINIVDSWILINRMSQGVFFTYS